MKWNRFTLYLILIFVILITSCNKTDPITITPTDTPVQLIQESIIDKNTISTIKPVHTFSFQQAVKVKWVTNNESFWISSLDNAFQYNSGTYEEIVRYPISEYTALFDVSSDGRLIAVSSENPEIIIWDVISNGVVQKIPAENFYNQALFSPDGKLLGTTNSNKIAISLWDIQSGNQIGSVTGFSTAAPVYGFQFGADNETVLWIARGSIQPSDFLSDTLGPHIGHQDFISTQALSPDGTLLATAAAGLYNDEFTPLVHVWDAKSGEEIVVFPFSDYISSLTFSPDGKLLAAGSREVLLVWDVETWELITTISAHTESLNSMAFSPDGTMLVTCGTEGDVKLWKLP